VGGIPEARNDEILIDFGGATARVVELFLKYDEGRKVSWWFSYALARAEETIRGIEFDGLLDQRTGTLRRLNNQDHTVYLDVNYRPSPRWHVNLSWKYYTGWPLTTYAYEEREQLHELVSKGKAAAYKQRHARVLLKADEGPHGSMPTAQGTEEPQGQEIRRCRRSALDRGGLQRPAGGPRVLDPQTAGR
jgi:hypothetical protein